MRCHPHERRYWSRAPRRDDCGSPASVREDASRVRRAFSFPLVQGDWQRRDDVWGDCGSVSRSPRVLLARIARRLSARAGEADRSGAGTRGWGDGPLTAHLHDHEDRAHAGHGMRAVKALISLDEAMRIARVLVIPIERNETGPIVVAIHRVSAVDVRFPIYLPRSGRAAAACNALASRSKF